MRYLKIIVFTVLASGVILLSCCHGGRSEKNQFSLSADTLLIRASRVKGTGVFNFGGGFLEFEDTASLFDYPIDYPDSLTNISGIRRPVDFRYELDYIDIICGQLPSKGFVVIVDQNNNQSFRDDTIFSLQPIDWYSSRNSIPVTFLVFDGTDTIQSRSWIRIGYWNGDIIYGRDEYLSASISIDDKHFNVGIIDEPLSGCFTYGLEPQITILSTELSKKDSIEVGDLIKMKEYLKLNEVYYKFDSISNNGNYIMLIKEKNFENKTGTQIGMLAPDFTFKSTSGDTVSTYLLHDKPLIIANSCGCGGDTKSSQAYFEMRETYKEDAYVLRLDSDFSGNPSDKWTINVGDKDNKDCYHKFRQAYCSRICYVVGPNRRILDKFQITDWKKNLPKLLNN
jgi:hypothetical protein